jgi:hypothetical protein
MASKAKGKWQRGSKSDLGVSDGNGGRMTPAVRMPVEKDCIAMDVS